MSDFIDTGEEMEDIMFRFVNGWSPSRKMKSRRARVSCLVDLGELPRLTLYSLEELKVW